MESSKAAKRNIQKNVKKKKACRAKTVGKGSCFGQHRNCVLEPAPSKEEGARVVIRCRQTSAIRKKSRPIKKTADHWTNRKEGRRLKGKARQPRPIANGEGGGGKIGLGESETARPERNSYRFRLKEGRIVEKETKTAAVLGCPCNSALKIRTQCKKVLTLTVMLEGPCARLRSPYNYGGKRESSKNQDDGF